ncbi:MAG: XRE family transcriptional regulator [Herbiconiux sp.]|uniref:helix-turn-helix domain-containing protein n=1 Tax=Herbiconiux sp. TaxID=1871186 RepID=UPI0012200C00|nr:helix-turn-helix transcriptional regulator [Herbiconiux sp.]TAJ46331.1 MAG: XRE family transcriptional regulator [Herbiconiux sp.]
MDTGKDPRSFRHALGYSQGELAEALDVSPRTVRNWEAHGAFPAKYVDRLARLVEKRDAAYAEMEPAEPRPEDDDENMSQFALSMFKASRMLDETASPQELLERHRAIFESAMLALDYVDVLVEAKVSRDLPASILSAVMDGIVQTGTLVMIAASDDEAMSGFLFRMSSIRERSESLPARAADPRLDRDRRSTRVSRLRDTEPPSKPSEPEAGDSPEAPDPEHEHEQQ